MNFHHLDADGAVAMMESKSGDDGDGDGVQPLVVSQRSCHVETTPASFWFKVVMFLAWSDAFALHATSKAVRDHTIGKWSPRLTVAAERAAMAVVASGSNRWQKLGWSGANSVGVKTFAVAPGRNNAAALVQRIRLSCRGLGGTSCMFQHTCDVCVADVFACLQENCPRSSGTS